MAARNKVIIEGSLGTQERWSVGVHYLGTVGGVVDDQGGLQTWADAAALAINDVWGGVLQTDLGSGNEVDQVTVQAYDATGPVQAQAIAEVTDASGAAAASHPYQVSRVYSLRSIFPGASRRGRIYWPACGAAITANSTFGDVAAVTTAAERMGQLLTEIGLASPLPEGSSLRVYSPTLDELTVVSFISCGTIPDTQRRRRNGLIEQYGQASMPQEFP